MCIMARCSRDNSNIKTSQTKKIEIIFVSDGQMRIPLQGVGSKLVRKFNPIQDGSFRGCSHMRRAKKSPPLRSVEDIMQ